MLNNLLIILVVFIIFLTVMMRQSKIDDITIAFVSDKSKAE